ncbi:MAG: hypothetical protein U5L00_04920 [Desulfovermiculus sp.]|nr:hypothetical protein [Desulfovermiculus sp.]
MNIGTWLAESGGVQDFLLRHVIRLLYKAVRDSEDPGSAEDRLEALGRLYLCQEISQILSAPLWALRS